MTDKHLTDEDRGVWWDVAKSIRPLWRRATRAAQKEASLLPTKMQSEAQENDGDIEAATLVLQKEMDALSARDQDKTQNKIPNTKLGKTPSKIKGDTQQAQGHIANARPVSKQQAKEARQAARCEIDFEAENNVFLEAMGVTTRIKSTPSGLDHKQQNDGDDVDNHAGVHDVTQNAVKYDAELPWLETQHLSRGDKKRIKQGLLKPTRSFDLHGYTVVRAERAVPQFLAQARRDGHHVVEIITGHGRFKVTDDGVEKGILKRLLPTWLENPLNRHMIKRVMEAPYSRGGAVWIILRMD